MMEECLDEPNNSEKIFTDKNHIEIKDELVDTVGNSREDAKYKESLSFDNVYVSNYKKEQATNNIDKEEAKKNTDQKRLDKESASQKPQRVENSRTQPVAGAAAKHSQKRQHKSSKSFLKARRPRLGYCGRYDAFGLYVAKKLEILPDRMAIFAQKMISDVLFEAEMGSLNRSSKVVAAQSHPRVRDFFENL